MAVVSEFTGHEDTGGPFEPLGFLLDAMPDSALCQLDACGNVSTWGGDCERLTGYGPFEMLERPLACLFSEDAVMAQIPQQLLADSARQGRMQTESWWMRKDGTRFFCRLTIAPLARDGFVLAMRDRSFRHEMEEELATAREMLHDYHRLELMCQMAGGAAHDFSTMMAVAKDGIAQMLRTGASDPERDSSLRAIEETIDHAGALAAQLLTYAKAHPQRREQFDVVECLLALRPMLESMLDDRIALKMHLAPDMIRISADRHHFETAILNLVVNARDAIIGEAESGRITLGVTPSNGTPPIRSHPAETGPYAVISVADTGPGIPSELRARIFDPFYTTKSAEAGAGLGLAQVMTFARQAGGNVEVGGESDQGAVLTLYLPRIGPRGVMALDVQTEGFGAAPSPELAGRVLLVEDNPRVAETTLMMLEDVGLTPIWARDAEDALAKLHQSEGGFDLVLTDVVMPRMSGIALARIIAARWPNLPVVLVSGYSDELTTGHGGDLELIQKPFTRKGLVGTLGRYLKHGADAPA